MMQVNQLRLLGPNTKVKRRSGYMKAGASDIDEIVAGAKWTKAGSTLRFVYC